MGFSGRKWMQRFVFLTVIFVSLQDSTFVTLGTAEESGLHFVFNPTNLQEDSKQYRLLGSRPICINLKERADLFAASSVNRPADMPSIVFVTYTDSFGAVKMRSVKARDLSSSWVWKIPNDEKHVQKNNDQEANVPLHTESILEGNKQHSTNEPDLANKNPNFRLSLVQSNPVKLRRQMLRRQRREERTAWLLQQDDRQAEEAAIRRARELDTTPKARYSIWRKEYTNPNSDSTLKLMQDQITMAKVYASIASSKNEMELYHLLIIHLRKAQISIRAATSDTELQSSALDLAKEMGHVLSLAKDHLYDSPTTERKLRAMLQSTDAGVDGSKKQSAFLIQQAAKTVPRPLHCLPLLLVTNYYLQGYESKEFPYSEKLEDPSLYHYAIFSDNVLATSVVINSTVQHVKDPEKHVFHIVTDKLNIAAMKMWFFVNPPTGAVIEVKNVDDFTWLNSSYCPVLHQLESARMKDYYFKANQASSLTAGSDNLKYRNPKYLSMLNHLRFYLPEVYPKLDKILFLDDDIVVQKDLTPLWSVDLQGMVNGAVETCKQSFHRFDKYLNFSNPKISENFDPNACGWAFGMNIFDLKEWRKKNITGIYHKWQEMNEDRTLWKLGTLPPGLITFYNLTHPLDRSWHVLGLGYDPALNQTEIENGVVIHYNGNYKPWLDLAIAKYRSYWSRYVTHDNSYLRICNIKE